MQRLGDAGSSGSSREQGVEEEPMMCNLMDRVHVSEGQILILSELFIGILSLTASRF